MSNEKSAHPPGALPLGTRLGELEVRRVLGIGGFGIVYLAWDHGLEREVAVKEYMPSTMAERSATLHVSLRTGSDADTFALGLRSFVNEARLLARFDHPSLLKVHRFWEAHGTAYMAMPLYRGPTLRQVRQAMDGPPDEAWLRRLLDPLLGALGVLHDAGVYHRDIAPDNIVLEEDGQPVLLDFGAARRVIGDRTQTLTAILKPAYAPIEQYAEGTYVKQGPWTDLYGLGATLHYMLLGRPPVPATTRAVHDEQPPLASQAIAGCSPDFLALLDWMLVPRPSERPQSVSAVREALEGRRAVPRPAAPPAAPVDDDATIVMPRSVFLATAQVRPPAPAPAPEPADVPATMQVPLPAAAAPARAAARPPAPPPPAPAPAPARRSRAPLAAGLLVGVAAVAGVLWWAGSSPGPAEAQALPASAPEVAAAAPASAVSAAPLPQALPPPEPLRDAAPPPAVPVPVPAAGPAPAPAPRAAPRPAQPAPPAVPPASVSGPESFPAPAPDRRAQPPASAPQAVRPASVPAPAPAPTASPAQRCEGRLLVALSRCMQRECAAADSRQHPDCVKWRSELDRMANPQQ